MRLECNRIIHDVDVHAVYRTLCVTAIDSRLPALHSRTTQIINRQRTDIHCQMIRFITINAINCHLIQLEQH